MAGKFNLNQLLTDVSKSAAPGGTVQPSTGRVNNEIVKLSVYDLVPSDDNFYSMGGIEELKSNIELAGKVLQNLIVVPLDGGKYKVISGHRRRLASISLVEEGKSQYEFVPCVIEADEADAEVQAIREEIMLIATNSQREKTAWDKLEEVRRTRALMERIKRQEKMPGGTRDLVAKTLNTSPAQIGRFDAILKNLCPEFMEEIKQGRINISTAYELSGLPAENQQAAFAVYRASGTISIKDAQGRKKPEYEQPPQEPPLPGQINFNGDTYGEGQTKAEPETVSPIVEKSAGRVQEPQPTTVTPEAPKAPDPNKQREPDINPETDEIELVIEQLGSLRNYCRSMDAIQSIEDSREGVLWGLYVCALEVAIKKLEQGVGL